MSNPIIEELHREYLRIRSAQGPLRVREPLAYPPLETPCTAGPGMRCQCASCRAMRKQLWAVQPEDESCTAISPT